MEILRTFRGLQAIADLRTLAAGLLPCAQALPLFDGDERAALRLLVEQEGCTFGSDKSLQLLPRLEALADDKNAPDDIFALANAVLMTNALLGGESTGVIWQMWRRSSERIRALPRRYSVPLSLATLGVAKSHSATGAPNPGVAGETTVDVAKTSAALIAIARAATEEELLHISRADYGDEQSRHLAALRDVIFERNCLFHDDQHWYPSEVVELVSHVPGETGFVVATAVLLNHCMLKGDDQGSTDFRWENNAAAYLDLPQNLRNPILAAFRAIYETDLGWAPYYSALFDPTDNRAVLLPPAAPELTRM